MQGMKTQMELKAGHDGRVCSSAAHHRVCATAAHAFLGLHDRMVPSAARCAAELHTLPGLDQPEKTQLKEGNYSQNRNHDARGRHQQSDVHEERRSLHAFAAGLDQSADRIIQGQDC